MVIFRFLPEIIPSSSWAVMTARCVTSFTNRLGWFATLLTVSMDRLVMERRTFIGFLSCFTRSNVRVRWRALFSFFFSMVLSVT